MAATNLTGMVSGYMFDQREREDSLLTEKAAASAAELFANGAPEELNRMLAENAQSMNGRLMVIDNDGKVQFDTFGTMCGRRLPLEEVLQVLTAGETSAYGRYTPGRETVREMSGEENAEYVAYSVHEMTGGNGRIAAHRSTRFFGSLAKTVWPSASSP